MSKANLQKQTARTPLMAVAACSMALPGSSVREIQLTPAGEFRSFDGRPAEVPAWRMTAHLAKPLIAAATARPTPTSSTSTIKPCTSRRMANRPRQLADFTSWSGAAVLGCSRLTCSGLPGRQP